MTERCRGRWGMAAPESLKGTCGSSPRGKQRPGPVNDRRCTTEIPRDLNPAPRGKMGTQRARKSWLRPGNKEPPCASDQGQFCYFLMPLSRVTLSRKPESNLTKLNSKRRGPKFFFGILFRPRFEFFSQSYQRLAEKVCV